MIKKSLYVLTVVMVLFGLLAVAAPAYALGTRRVAKGTVIAINNAKHVMTVHTTRGTNIALKFTSKTLLRRNHKPSNIKKLHVGDHVNVKYNPLTKLADDIDDTPGDYEFQGTIAAVDIPLNTVTIASEDGGSTVTLKVDANTVYVRNGAPSTLAALLVGDKVEAKFDSTTMLASFIDAEAESGELNGTISAIDTTLGTVTITPDGGGADVTLSTGISTVFKKDDNLVKLADLQVGDKVEAKYDTATLLASLFDVESH